MTEQEHYSLRWNNHQNHILRAFDALLQTKTLVDVTLVCAETSIRAHKVVLSACSPFFQRVFSETPCKHPVIVLKDFRGWVVQAIVDFMYRGEISVPQERLQLLIQAGESLQVRGLVDHTAADVTPTLDLSPDDFMDTSGVSAPSSPQNLEFEDPPTMVSNHSKHLVPPHVFVERSHTIAENPETCTSPMPRRKQARPRRRSGECAPHDLTSKSTTPVPTAPSSNNNQETEDESANENVKESTKDERPESSLGDELEHDHDNEPEEPINETDTSEVPEDLCTKNSLNNNSDNLNNNNSSNNNNNRIVLSLKDIRHLNRPTGLCRPPVHQNHTEFVPSVNPPSFLQGDHMKRESLEAHCMENDSSFMEQMDLTVPHHPGLHNMKNTRHDIESNIHKDFTPSSPMSLPSHFHHRDGPPHPPSPLPFPGLPSGLTLTPPHHMFGLDSPLALFPPGMDPAKLYNPLMEMSDPRGMHPDHHGPFLKKKMSRPKGQHSAPRGGPPRSWTNAELTEALQHVWNKKMTTSQASRIFGIPYNSLLMYVRGKYGKSLKLEQLRKDCISGPPIELLTMGMNVHNNNNKALNENRNKDPKDHMDNPPMQRSSSSEPDLLSSPNPMFNPFPPSFYPDFTGGFPGLPLSMLNLLPPDRHHPAMHLAMDEDCKSDRSKQSLEDDFPQPLALNRDERRELIHQNGQE